MVTGINYTYRGDNFAMYVNVKSLCCTLESNTSYVNFTSTEKMKKTRNTCAIPKNSQGIHALEKSK